MRTLSVSLNAYPQTSADSAPDWVYFHMRPAELMSLRFSQDIFARSLSGTHWVSWDGRDLFLEQNQTLRLTPGMALIDGPGVLQIALAPKPEKAVTRFGQWLIAPLLLSHTEPLRIEIH